MEDDRSMGTNCSIPGAQDPCSQVLRAHFLKRTSTWPPASKYQKRKILQRSISKQCVLKQKSTIKFLEDVTIL